MIRTVNKDYCEIIKQRKCQKCWSTDIITRLFFKFSCLACIQCVQDSDVRSPLILEGPPSHIVFPPGERITLPCRADANPAPTYEWYLNDIKLNTSNDTSRECVILEPDKDGTLHLKTSAVHQGGYYQCKARNSAGADASNISFVQPAVFSFKDGGPRRSVHNVTVMSGRFLVLPCRLDSVPKATVTWYMTSSIDVNKMRESRRPVTIGERITVDDRGWLIFLTTYEHDSEMLYHCEAYNYVMRQSLSGSQYRLIVQNDPYDLDRAPEVLYAPPTVRAMERENITLLCLFSAKPSASVVWFRQDLLLLPLSAQVTDSGRRITFTDLEPSDSAVYVCTATNSIGVRQAFVNLTVASSLQVLQSPLSQIVSFGGSATFYCSGRGLAYTYATWFINNQPISSAEVRTAWTLHEDGSLTLFDLKLRDSATVQCNLSDSQGSILLSARLVVLNQTLATPPTTPVPINHDFTITSVTIQESSFIASTERATNVISAGKTTSQDTATAAVFTSPTYLTAISTLPLHDNKRQQDPVYAQQQEKVVSKGYDALNAPAISHRDAAVVPSTLDFLWLIIPVVAALLFALYIYKRRQRSSSTYYVDQQESVRGNTPRYNIDRINDGTDDIRVISYDPRTPPRERSRL